MEHILDGGDPAAMLCEFITNLHSSSKSVKLNGGLVVHLVRIRLIVLVIGCIYVLFEEWLSSD